MREIVFTGKHKEFGHWAVGDLLHDRDGKVYIDTSLNEVIEETVGQYTGTDDISKTMIFDGKIVKAYKHGDLESKPFTEQITYRVGTFWFGNWTWVEFLNVFRYPEIIGNIHDNPELIEQ